MEGLDKNARAAELGDWSAETLHMQQAEAKRKARWRWVATRRERWAVSMVVMIQGRRLMAVVAVDGRWADGGDDDGCAVVSGVESFGGRAGAFARIRESGRPRDELAWRGRSGWWQQGR